MGETDTFPEPVNLKGQRATFENEKYGIHPRNNFDIWLADSDKPTPLVIYIHGGGFVGGDKSKYYAIGRFDAVSRGWRFGGCYQLSFYE